MTCRCRSPVEVIREWGSGKRCAMRGAEVCGVSFKYSVCYSCRINDLLPRRGFFGWSVIGWDFELSHKRSSAWFEDMFYFQIA